MSKNVKEVFNDVMVSEGVELKSLKKMFIWYDLLSCALSFQLLFILAYSIGIDYSATMLCVLCIVAMDIGLKNALERDSKNYKKLESNMALVKLWTISLLTMGIATSVALIMVTFGLV